MDRYLPIGLGGLSTVAASILDINWGALAGGITVFATAAGAGYWQFAQKRLQVLRDEGEARVKLQEREAAAKLVIYRDAELAKIQIQRERDEANKGSLSSQLEAMTGQLTAIQHSADEANLALRDAREFNIALKAQLAEAQARVEDANNKLHKLNNDENAKVMRHEAEKLELQQKYADLVTKLDAAHAENRELLIRVDAKAAAAKAQADQNSEMIRDLAPPPGAP